MRTIYVSTPVTSRQEKTIEEQMFCAYRRHRELEKLWKSQIGVGDAFETFYWVTNERMSNAEAMGRCIELLLTCDTILVDADYEKSNGCRSELEVAKIYGLEVYFVKNGKIEKSTTCNNQ